MPAKSCPGNLIGECVVHRGHADSFNNPAVYATCQEQRPDVTYFERINHAEKGICHYAIDKVAKEVSQGGIARAQFTPEKKL